MLETESVDKVKDKENTTSSELSDSTPEPQPQSTKITSTPIDLDTHGVSDDTGKLQLHLTTHNTQHEQRKLSLVVLFYQTKSSYEVHPKHENH